MAPSMKMCSSSQSFLVQMLIFIISILFVGFKYISFQLKTRKKFPPCPPKLPIIGNLHQLGSNPHRSLQTMSQKYGPLILIHLGSVPTLVASSAEAAREIMKIHDLSFCDRPNLTIPNILLHGCKDIAFSSYGEFWRQLKSVVVVHALSNTRVKSFRSVREEELGSMISAIETMSQKYGSLVNLSELFLSCTNNIFCRVSLGRTYDGLNFADLLKDFVGLLGVSSIGDYISWLSWIDRLSGLEKRAEKTAKEFDNFLDVVIEEHVSKKKGENSQTDQVEDLVDVLLDVLKDTTADFILYTKAVIMDMFSAGSHTVFATIDWTLCELLRDPRSLKKLQKELTEIAQGKPLILEEDLEKMNYLKAVIKEALRLHPPGPLLVPRQARQEVKLMGYDVPKGTQVIVNAFAIGRDPTMWEDSDEFRPERFLDNIDYKELSFDWVPFGAGRRRCPGIQFAVPVIELAVANVVYKFNLELPNGLKNSDLDMSEATAITVYRKSALMVTASPRF